MSNRRITRRSAVVLVATLLVLLVVLVVVFVRASIEAGEERLWLYVYLFVLPAVMGGAVAWGLDGLTWPLRLALGILTVPIVAVLLVQAVLFADKIYENPANFRPILPVIIRAESFYLGILVTEPERNSRHQEKAKRWRDIASHSEAAR